ncbi:metal-dependent hydrolase [Candidatus Nanohalobium constans]|uniref:Metal-dependent hydrolase n=1 Tax=Candidatus Nanohalobium constans TaxID=2565781 RepID=A0A5Q0UFR5_9ARCH|nr:metal-dependent hydrolase [Candidatus Nanohalobium constans]QGA80427.1 hypothetical protein LC1Nh_0528 [Candidatus Nanohalobium constans]
MNPRSHAVISLVLGLLLGVLKQELFVEVVFVAFVSGTLIDVDHFVVGRFVHGDWRFLKSTFSSFWASVTDVQSVVGEEEEFGPLYRIFSHSVILMILMIAGFYSDILLIEVAAVSTGVHLLSDLYADVFLW